MVHLLMTRSSLDACQWKQVLDFEMALHQNEAEVIKAIKEAKAHCGATIREAETCCTADIRKAESHCAVHAHSIQQSHAKDMQCLEMEACGVLMGPLHLLTGNMSLATLLNIPPQVPSTREESMLVISCATTPVAPRPLPGTKQCHHSPIQVVSLPWPGDEATGTFGELPCLRWKDEMHFMKSLKGSQQEAFAKDSD